jgi:hypothetical protein
VEGQDKNINLIFAIKKLPGWKAGKVFYSSIMLNIQDLKSKTACHLAIFYEGPPAERPGRPLLLTDVVYLPRR